MSKPKNSVLIGICILVLITGCLQQSKTQSINPTAESKPWMNFELTDVKTGKEFRFSDFQGKPVLIQSFAVWCPTCLEQQKQMEKLQQEKGDSIVLISLDADPNEDEEQVRGHMQEHDLNWHFAVSPINLTQQLIDEFGLIVVSAPADPIILICEDQSTRLLKRGLKLAGVLKTEIETGC